MKRHTTQAWTPNLLTLQTMNKRSQTHRDDDYDNEEDPHYEKVHGDGRKKDERVEEDFATLLARCVEAQKEETNQDDPLTDQDLETITSYGAERLEELHDRLTQDQTEVPDDEQSKKEMQEQLNERKVKGRVVLIPDVPEQVERITECPEKLPEFAQVLEEFDDETFKMLLEEPRWLLAEKKERTAQRKCLGEFETFSKTLIGRKITTVQDCDKILFGANKTHARLKEDFVFRPKGAITSYRIFFYYIDECMFSCLVLNTTSGHYMGCFFIQSHRSLQADLATSMRA